MKAIVKTDEGDEEAGYDITEEVSDNKADEGLNKNKYKNKNKSRFNDGVMANVVLMEMGCCMYCMYCMYCIFKRKPFHN